MPPIMMTYEQAYVEGYESVMRPYHKLESDWPTESDLAKGGPHIRAWLTGHSEAMAEKRQQQPGQRGEA